MPLALMLIALCSGVTAALVWLSIGGSGLLAFAVYVLTGQLVMAGLLTKAALRALR